MKDTIKIVDDEKWLSLHLKKLLWQAQTLRFKNIIISAYKHAENGIRVTDDAGAAEKAGYKVTMFEGNYKNIKLTSPEDFRMAEYFLTCEKFCE